MAISFALSWFAVFVDRIILPPNREERDRKISRTNDIKERIYAVCVISFYFSAGNFYVRCKLFRLFV